MFYVDENGKGSIQSIIPDELGLGYVTKEWAKLFLTNWNRAVSVWNNGELFTDKEWPSKSVSQQYYAKLCCTWIIPNGMVEPHCTAEGL